MTVLVALPEDELLRLETFIQQVHDLDYIISSGEIDPVELLSSPGTAGRKKWLAEKWGAAMAAYQTNKGDPEERDRYGRLCVELKAQLFAENMVLPGEGLARKLRGYRDENTALKTKLSELESKYQKCADEMISLETRIAELKQAGRFPSPDAESTVESQGGD